MNKWGYFQKFQVLGRLKNKWGGSGIGWTVFIWTQANHKRTVRIMDTQLVHSERHFNLFNKLMRLAKPIPVANQSK